MAQIIAPPPDVKVIQTVQRGTSNMSTATTTIISISNIDINKSFLVFTAAAADYVATSDIPKYTNIRGKISSSTSITFAHNAGLPTSYRAVEWEVVEYA